MTAAAAAAHGGPEDVTTPGATGRSRRAVAAAAVGALVVVAAVVVLLWSRQAVSPVDAGFARDMQDHHLQAVEMATLVREATDDPEIRSLALDIQLTQQHQAGQMYGWLESWGLPQNVREPAMAWMSAGEHGHDDDAASLTADGLMPGMATRAELNELAGLEGADAERLFLTLMIDHHVAGVDMAEHAAQDAGEQVVRDLAASIARAQEAEITVLEDLLAARGGPDA
ncbi:DUF305 domain-containing protein [Actinotalea sp. AC32]|nr:DUF305 domain-containing protein [Actinotalea sp. AC32]